MNFWNEIYSHFSPIAFSAFGFDIHWYSLAYISALILAFLLAKYFINVLPRFKHLESSLVESYFLWVEFGIIIGARLGYLLIYTDSGFYYLTHPWQAFNPYIDGEFVGIAGMSFHGGVIGFLLASCLFGYIKKVSTLALLDLIALSVPLAYVFGRIGNFLNKELYGRVIEEESLQFLGIYVEGALRYPSQLIEAFLEGIVVFIVVFIASKRLHTNGILIVVYAFAYSIARFIAEYFREADSQMGYYFLHLSMGQILSFAMMFVAFCLFLYLRKQEQRGIDNKQKK